MILKASVKQFTCNGFTCIQIFKGTVIVVEDDFINTAKSLPYPCFR